MRSSINRVEFPAAFHAFKYEAWDHGKSLGEMTLAAVQQQFDAGEISEEVRLYHPEKQSWLTLPQMAIYLRHVLTEYRLHEESFAVQDQGVVQGEYTLDEICLKLNRGTLSAEVLIDDAGHWKTIEEMGIEYEVPESNPAVGWAG